MQSTIPLLFEQHPDPMWVYDIETLAVLDVNRAALEKYGYARDEFLALGAAQLRAADGPPGKQPGPQALLRGEFVCHLLKSGDRIWVEERAAPVVWGERAATLVIARDVTRLLALESERTDLLARERASRQEALDTTLHFQAVFEALPGKFLVLEPVNYRIVAASDAYLQATMTRREQILGRPIFETFPDDPAESQPESTRSLRRSLDRVRESLVTDVMGVQRYPIPNPEGGFEERFWTPISTPVRSADGALAFIIHRVEDVTEFVRAGGPLHRLQEGGAPESSPLELEILLQARELREANLQLQKREAMLRTAERLVGMGSWQLDFRSGRLTWSENTYRICGVTPARFGHRYEDYRELVHPEDRHLLDEHKTLALEQGRPFDFVHRLIRPDGWLRYVHAVAEVVATSEGEVLAGVIQDITRERVAAAEAAAALDSLRIAGRIARLGGWRYDAERKRLYWSAETFALYEATGSAQPRLEQALEYFLDQDRERMRSALQRCLQQGIDFDEVARIRTARGAVRWVRTIASASKDAAGAIRGLQGAVQDISELMEAREAERRSREELLVLQAAVARQSDLLVITDAATEAPAGPRIVYVNDAFVRQTGHAREEAIGQTLRILQGPDTDRAELDRIAQALRRKQPVRAELLNYTKAGEPFWVELDIAPVASEEGALTHFVAVQRDVTHRKEAERRARLSEERFELLARATNDVVWDWDLRQGTLWWNEAYEVLFGYDRAAESPGPASWTGHIHPEDRDRVVQGIHAALDGSATRWADEYRFVAADGSLLDIIDRGFVLRDEQGRAVRMIGSMIDLTAMRALEEQLRQAQKLDAIGQLTGGVAHDFNNLLTVILGNAELLTGALARSPKLRGLAETTLHAAVRGAELTSRLLAFARKQALQPRRVDVNALIAGMEDLVRRSLGEQLDIEFALDPELWAAHVDAGQLESALLNLCINARDAMTGGGKLRIETVNAVLDAAAAAELGDVEPGRFVRISVADTGVGMDRETLERAFEPFFTTKEEGRGSGLGLSMVYGFARQSAGHVRIFSTPGLGTTVRLYLPQDARGGDPVPVQPPQQTRGGTESILLVEDNDLVRGHAQTLLDSLGYGVCAVSRAQDALLQLRDRHFDLLFTDIVMPGGMNGRQLAEETQRLYPGLPILLTSGYAQDVLAAGGGLPQSLPVLQKPYRRHELAAAIRRLLDRADAAPAV